MVRNKTLVSIISLLKNLLFITVPSLLLIFFACELFFTYVIPGAQFPYVFYDRNNRILKFDISQPRTGRYTIGKLAQQRARWRINNHGWNSDIDYETKMTKRKRPLIAIIGDSYVEALQVDVEKNVAADLRNMVHGKYDVYSFGISGAPLSAYLQMSRYVNKYFDPAIIVFIIIHNDFHESLYALNQAVGMMRFDKDASGFKEINGPYNPTWYRRLIGHSSLARYLWVTLKLDATLFGKKPRPGAVYDEDIDVSLINEHKDEIAGVTDFILRRLRSENPSKKIVFLIDAPRNDIYSHAIDNSSLMPLHRLLKEKCDAYGFYFSDLTGVFKENFASTGIRFDSPYDYHWNALGHRVAAETLFNKLKEISALENRP